MHRRRATLIAFAVAVAGVAVSCAYSVRTSALPTHLRTVAIPVFENATSEYTLEQEITNAVIDRFVRDNQLKVVDERQANAVIRGKVVSYKNSVFGFSQETRAQEYRVTIGLSVTFKDLVKNREVWSEANLVKSANYYISSVPGDSARTEQDGRRQAIQKIADEILARTTEGW